MKKKLLNLLIPLLAIPAVMWADERHSLIISFHDDSSVVLLLCDKPRATFVDDELWVESEQFYATYKRSDIAEFYFMGSTTTSFDVLSGHSTKIVYTDNDRVQVCGVSPTSNIGVYSLDGRCLDASLTCETDGIIIDLTSYPTGTYLININHAQTFKIINK